MNRDFRWSGPEKIIDITKYLMQYRKNEIKVLEISYRCNYIVEKKTSGYQYNVGNTEDKMVKKTVK